MLKIYNTVKALLVKHQNESDDFKRGWQTALDYLRIGIKSSFQFNYAVQNKELEAENQKLKDTIKNQRKEIQILNDKLLDYTLLNIKPTETYTSYRVDTTNSFFEIITNMDKSSFEFCLLNFGFRHSCKRIDECKSKLLTFINNRNYQGFRAFKDKKSYNRYLNGKT